LLAGCSYTVTVSDSVTGAIVDAANWTFPPATAIAQTELCLF
jgi:hypothetical protein